MLNEQSFHRLNEFRIPRKLEFPIDYKLAKSGLLVSKEQQRILPKNSFRKLSAWLHITNECNLACSYCCKHHKSHGHMTKKIGTRAIRDLSGCKR